MPKDLEELHVECVRALRSYMAEANKTCKLLVNIKEFPVSLEMRQQIEEQRLSENLAHDDYQDARLALFSAAKWT
jgi:hypothetical protein